MEIQPQKPEFRSYPKNFNPCRELHETCGVCVREIPMLCRRINARKTADMLGICESVVAQWLGTCLWC